jgi:hypothetical protein
MATLDDMIARLRSLGPAMVQEAMPELTAAVRTELQRSIASASTPEGSEWEPRKAGGPALQNAINAVHVAAVGTTIMVRLTGPEARHHLGRARGGVAREILPTGALPTSWKRALKRVLDRRFTEATGG